MAFKKFALQFSTGKFYTQSLYIFFGNNRW